MQAFNTEDVDAALLMLALLDLPLDKSVFAGTVGEVEKQMREGDFVHRHRAHDGLPGGEGAFLICSFWLVDALLILDRAEEARGLFERLLVKANDVGLYAEEVNPSDGAFLGSFPQAFTHLALINCAVHLELHASGGIAALAGTQADRARRARSAMVQGDARPFGGADRARHAHSRRSVLDLRQLAAPQAGAGTIPH